MSTLEQEFMERITRLDEDKQRRILEFIETIEKPRTYTAIELMQLAPEERSKAIAASFAASADEDFEIFEANSDEDFDDYDES